jgi:hypothetical protein
MLRDAFGVKQDVRHKKKFKVSSERAGELGDAADAAAVDTPYRGGYK